jgi:hypothetical protein
MTPPPGIINHIAPEDMPFQGQTGWTNPLISNFTSEELLSQDYTGAPSYARVRKYFEQRPQEGGKSTAGESSPARDAADTLCNLFHHLAALRVEQERLAQAVSTETDFGETQKERRSRIRWQSKHIKTCLKWYRRDMEAVSTAILVAMDRFVRGGDDPFTIFSEYVTYMTDVTNLPWVGRSFSAGPTQKATAVTFEPAKPG